MTKTVTKTEKIPVKSDAPLTLSKKFLISPVRLFKLLSTPNYLEQWLSPHESISIKVIEYNFIVGGKYILEYIQSDGTQVECHGEFITINSPNEISLTWEWQKPDSHAGIQTTVTWLLQKVENETKLTIIHDGANTQFYERHKIGWSGTFNRLATLILNKCIQ